MAWNRNDMNNARDMSVANLLQQVFDRAKEQKTEMDNVSEMFNAVQTKFLTSRMKSTVLLLVSKVIDEKLIQTAILVTAGDRMAMMYLIKKANLLTNQLLRPAPRVLRTKQLFNNFRQAWRYAVGLHMSKWEEILQNNSVAILKDMPMVKGSTAVRGIMERVREALQSGRDIDENDD